MNGWSPNYILCLMFKFLLYEYLCRYSTISPMSIFHDISMASSCLPILFGRKSQPIGVGDSAPAVCAKALEPGVAEWRDMERGNMIF